MEAKAENPASLLQDDDIHPLARAYFELCQLKQLYRRGWLLRGVPHERCESVAEHSFGVALLALWLAEAYYPEMDTNKLLRMALLHDFGEVYAGDITPVDGVTPQEKSRRETASMEQVLSKLPGGQGYLELWDELERGETPEARFVRQVDRLEMGLQAGVYRAQGFERMGEFLASARQEISDQPLLGVLAAVDGFK
jgi:putative hydrolase of HD superfamily